MSDKNNQTGDEAAILRRLESLETQITRHDDLQVKLKYISLSGLFLVLFFFLLFVYRLINYVRHYEVNILIDNLRAQSMEVVKPEIELFLNDLRSDLLPTFSKQLTDEFDKQMPLLKDTTLELGHRLEEKVRLHAEERLVESMITGLESSEKEIQIIFPAFTAENLEKQIGQSMTYYVDTLHDSLEERIAYISSSIETLKSSIMELGKSDAMKDHVPTTKEQAEAQVLDSILDLVVYEIKPELGDEPVKK